VWVCLDGSARVFVVCQLLIDVRVCSRSQASLQAVQHCDAMHILAPSVKGLGRGV
jgi:hypothetical protein